jgi:hypothetical protein
MEMQHVHVGKNDAGASPLRDFVKRKKIRRWNKKTEGRVPSPTIRQNLSKAGGRGAFLDHQHHHNKNRCWTRAFRLRQPRNALLASVEITQKDLA